MEELINYLGDDWRMPDKVGSDWRTNWDHYYSCNEKYCSTMCWIGEKLQCPPAFIAVMLRDIADAFDEKPAEGESSCGCC